MRQPREPLTDATTAFDPPEFRLSGPSQISASAAGGLEAPLPHMGHLVDRAVPIADPLLGVGVVRVLRRVVVPGFVCIFSSPLEPTFRSINLLCPVHMLRLGDGECRRQGSSRGRRPPHAASSAPAETPVIRTVVGAKLLARSRARAYAIDEVLSRASLSCTNPSVVVLVNAYDIRW
jgi:hypothetical protein